jgi:hypothetical protein
MHFVDKHQYPIVVADMFGKGKNLLFTELSFSIFTHLKNSVLW